jgi:putative isomerase
MVREHVLNPDELRSPHGLRSLSRNEPAYEVAVGSNPSCWRGPIWIVANYLAWRGLTDYGFVDEAERLALDVNRLMANDIERNGLLHEYYHPDTGEGLTHPGFLNWNTLAVRMRQDDAAGVGERRSRC